jgi:D-proline reductase (dithiol) PrdB
MARLEGLPGPIREHLEHLACPSFDRTPWVTGGPLSGRRIAIVSTAGIHAKGDAPFIGFADEFRIIPGQIRPDDLVMSHISANFDRTGFYRDPNVVFPLQRLKDLADQGIIGAVADRHYSFMGATDPLRLEAAAGIVAAHMHAEGVDGVLLVPV